MTSYGAIEAGGTKFVCGVVTENGDVKKRAVFPTTTPTETLARVIQFFEQQVALKALGIGCFGPISLHKEAKNYGAITSTPKVTWRDFNIVNVLSKALNLPIAFDTDVNAAVLGETTFGEGINSQNVVYITVGTGIGGGIISDGCLVHGMRHPEMGHMRLSLNPDDPLSEGICPYHGNCLEGLASGPAIEKRWGQSPKALAVDHPAWTLQADYLAQALMNLFFCFSVEVMILGGGVMQQRQLFPLIKQKLKQYVNGYAAEGITEFNVMPPKLGTDAGLIGAMVLARDV